MPDETNELLCPVCHDPAGKHINHDGGGGCVTNKGSEICGCVISSNSLYELQEQLEKLQAYENPQNYAHMRNLANAAADALACWMDEDRANELDNIMGALKRALENYKG